MSIIWNHLIDCQNKIIDVFNVRARHINEPGLSEFNRPENGWLNQVWSNQSVRRAHIDVVDARDSKGLWMMHVCVFPNLNNDAPIYGFDVIAGSKKITGAFHDFSPSATKDHPMIDLYKKSVSGFTPKKSRDLPQWARNIFTDQMLAAGNINTEDEVCKIINIALDNLNMWFENVSLYDNFGDTDSVRNAQNYYAINQQKNPHTPAVMKSLGLPEEDVEKFCKDILFPKI